MRREDIPMKRTTINSLAEQFANHMIGQTASGNAKNGQEWGRELNKFYQDLPPKEKRKVANKVVRIIKAAGSPNDANM
jgi:hypothetical protein